jgi:eukaryotic-like serine/threonine-protein kinase
MSSRFSTSIQRSSTSYVTGMDSTEQAVYVGELLDGRYQINAAIGSGNFSGVFRATDITDGADVAVKVLSFRSSSSPEARIEFDGEAELLGMLASCSNVVTLLGRGQHTITLSHGGVPLPVTVDFLVLELADACLCDLLVRRHELAWSDRLRLFRGIVKGVHQMHLRRTVHRDLKSDNGLVFSRPEETAKVSDLGRSRDTHDPPRFRPEAYMAGRGDLRFAPPECVWLCGSDVALEMARADLYLIGSILFEFASGVGLTSLALGDPRRIMIRVSGWPDAARSADFERREHELIEQYAPAYELFRAELPPHLRAPASNLLMHLTHPNPSKRIPGFRRHLAADEWDLQWLLERIDSLLRIEDIERRRLERKSRRKARQR